MKSSEIETWMSFSCSQTITEESNWKILAFVPREFEKVEKSQINIIIMR